MINLTLIVLLRLLINQFLIKGLSKARLTTRCESVLFGSDGVACERQLLLEQKQSLTQVISFLSCAEQHAQMNTLVTRQDVSMTRVCSLESHSESKRARLLPHNKTN